jgi:MoaA/NifB/PqqE/SkfB family radical SAM enzyme
MYKYEDVRVVHLEITGKCQAGCSMCSRNDETDSDILVAPTTAELSYEDCVKIFPKDLIKQLSGMYMCGNYGDPIIAKDTLEVFEYFRYANRDMELNMYTNGGARSPTWWKDLAGILQHGKGRVVFAVDGLEDTNHIYRENVRWNNVMSSAKAFIAAGGEARWHYLVFKHNEHQVEEARELAKKMGFASFVVKRTSRWQGQTTYKHLSQPEKKEYVHQVNNIKAQIVKIYGSFDNFVNKTSISCRVQKERGIYITAEGLMVPCCWLGGSAIYDADKRSYKEGELFQHMGGDKSNINAKVHGIKKILEDGFFDKIEKSWSSGSTTNGKLKTCAKVCSVDHDNFGEQFIK